MQINSLPVWRPDETLYSVVARTRLMNAAKDDRDACRSLFGYSRNTRVSDFPVNLVHFCDVTKGAFGTPCNVLNDMTLTEFFNRIDSHPWSAGNSRLPISTAGYGLSTLSNGRSNIWRACALCLKSEMAQDATAYWHRSHQLPAAVFCAIHDEPLSVCLSPIQVRHKHFLLPQDTVLANDFYRQDLAENYATLARLTQLSVDVLRDSDKPIEPRVARAAIFNALDEHGLLAQARLIRSEQFFVEFSRSYGNLQKFSEFCGALSRPGIDILHRKLRHGYLKRSAVHNLLLIDWLFGSWDAFHQCCLWQSTMDDIPSHAAQPESETLKNTHRGTCLDFLNINAPATRTRFFRSAPASFRWLLRYDTKWLDNVLPTTRSVKNQRSLF